MIAKFFIFLLLLFGTVWFMGRSDWHVNRNKNNKLPIGNLKPFNGSDAIFIDSLGLTWERQPHIKNKFHQPDEEVKAIENPYPNVDTTLVFDAKNPNLKFLSKAPTGGSYEAILQPNGVYLTTGLKQGTFNYGHPSGLGGSLKHVVLDVLPHFVNSKYQ